MLILWMFLSILGVDLVYPACPMVRSAKHGELFLSQGEKMVEKCEGLARFEQKKKRGCLRPRWACLPSSYQAKRQQYCGPDGPTTSIFHGK